MKYNMGDILLFPNGTIARIVKQIYTSYKLRCIRPTAGIWALRKGTPYTYQRWTTIEALNNIKNIKKIGTEELLYMVFVKKISNGENNEK